MKKPYKFTSANGETHGGYKWPLPKKVGGKWRPGAWTTPIEGKLEACANGYHLTDFKHWRDWRNKEMYEVEYKGRALKNGDKYVVRQARLVKRVEKWNDRTLRLFAVWCARNALAIVKNPDPRSVNAVDVAEKFVNGKATKNELAAAEAAADAAAWAAARAAAEAAALAAAGAAAEAAAGAAAEAAALAAARAAAEAAARAAARAAAGAAAEAAAWAAAGAAAEAAARAAAEAAAWAAAGAAALAAAEAAARAAQDEHLFEILGLKK